MRKKARANGIKFVEHILQMFFINFNSCEKIAFFRETFFIVVVVVYRATHLCSTEAFHSFYVGNKYFWASKFAFVAKKNFFTFVNEFTVDEVNLTNGP